MEIRKSVLGILLAGALVGVAGCGTSGDDAAAPEAETTTSEAAEMEETPSEEPTSEETAEEEPTSEETAEEAPEAAAEEVTITITDFEYDISGSVTPGAEVTVINNDSAGHTVTSDEEGLFDSVFGPMETVTFTAPDEPGEYSFICTLHPAMTGTLVVEE